MNPYDPPRTVSEPKRLSVLQWLAVVLCGALSTLATVAILSNLYIFLSLPVWPNKLWQWIGVSAMTFAMILFAFGMGWMSWGVLFQNRRRRNTGMICAGSSMACYVLCVVFSVVMRTLSI